MDLVKVELEIKRDSGLCATTKKVIEVKKGNTSTKTKKAAELIY